MEHKTDRKHRSGKIRFFTSLCLLCLLCSIPRFAAQSPAALDNALPSQYCVGCHNQRAKTAGLMLDSMDYSNISKDAATWEKVIRKIKTGMMPPSGARRPDRAVLDAFASEVEKRLDAAAAAHPNPGTTALHRLNRTEYANVIRDLLAMDVDVAGAPASRRCQRRVRQHRGCAGNIALSDSGIHLCGDENIAPCRRRPDA